MENEAVVAEVIRSDPDIELIPVSEILPSFREGGAQSWNSLDSDANPSTDIILKDSMLPPKEKRVSESLANCMRIWNDDIGGGDSSFQSCRSPKMPRLGL